MCVRLEQYPLVELEDNKKKVLFNYGVVVENRDFTPFDALGLEWRKAKIGLSKYDSFNRAVKEYGVKKFLKYTCVPCGICEDCLKAKARGWTFRILKECEKYENNFFITFTYDDEKVPRGNGWYTLIKEEISQFNKKLKVYLKRKGLNEKFRFYGVGEYGSTTFRPHYHVIYFNLDIPDLEFRTYENGNLHFTSEFISNIWNKGLVDIGAVDVGSAAYVARYCDKKLNRTKEEKRMLLEVCCPEFSVMSRRPGIGADYLDSIIDKVKNGIYSVDVRGQSFSIPLYYSKKVKDILADTKYLKDYEARNDLLIRSKIGNDIILSDLLATDLQHYYVLEDAYKKSCKKVRDNIKL